MPPEPSHKAATVFQLHSEIAILRSQVEALQAEVTARALKSYQKGYWKGFEQGRLQGARDASIAAKLRKVKIP